MEGTVTEGSIVTFTVLEKFPVIAASESQKVISQQAIHYADLLHEFTGTVSREEITGEFHSAFDYSVPVMGTIHYRVEGEFTVSVRPN